MRVRFHVFIPRIYHLLYLVQEHLQMLYPQNVHPPLDSLFHWQTSLDGTTCPICGSLWQTWHQTPETQDPRASRCWSGGTHPQGNMLGHGATEFPSQFLGFTPIFLILDYSSLTWFFVQDMFVIEDCVFWLHHLSRYFCGWRIIRKVSELINSLPVTVIIKIVTLWSIIISFWSVTCILKYFSNCFWLEPTWPSFNASFSEYWLGFARFF